MNGLFLPRRSYYTTPRVFAAVICSVVAGAIVIYVIETAARGHVSEVASILLAPGTAILLGALIWPSYRVGVAIAATFWACPFVLIIVSLNRYFGGLDGAQLLQAFGIYFLVAAVYAVWSILCVLFARMRLPIVYPAGHCQSCGYDLRGLDHARCPECGKVDATVGAGR